MSGHVTIRELAAWPLDSSRYRPSGHTTVPLPEAVPLGSAALSTPPELRTLLDGQHTRLDLLEQFHGLPWTTGLVDLTKLVAFQRRLVVPVESPVEHTWPALLALTFAKPRAPVYTSTQTASTLTLTSPDPNLQVSLSPLEIRSGNPFFEVATYRDRWFLRDGYHRAYALLRQGITAVPAVILTTHSLLELHGEQPNCFPESVLFAPRPPLVRDFLDDALNITWTRPPILKTIRVTIEEHFEGAIE